MKDLFWLFCEQTLTDFEVQQGMIFVKMFCVGAMYPRKKQCWTLLGLLSLGMFQWGCTKKEQSNVEGERLSQQYCSSCHQRPEPSQLPKAVWAQSVLPAMGAFADIYKDKTLQYKVLPARMREERDPAIANVRWSVTLEDWQKIVDYYVNSAPDQLTVPSFAGTPDRKQFNIRQLDTPSSPNTSCVYYDERNKLLFQGNALDGNTLIYDQDLKLVETIDGCKSLTQITPLKHDGKGVEYLLTHIGSINPGRSGERGFVERITLNNGKLTRRETLISDLFRPVQSAIVYVNKKGEEGIVVGEFGFMEGQLALFRKEGQKYVKSIISKNAGAQVIYPEDINKDGLTDLWVLFASGREGICQFINQGNGKFEEKWIMTFPPEYGSSFFYLTDFDKDGLQDIAYTSGDNADLSQVLKPYHGFYLFRNTGKGFEKKYFKHINGCYKALPGDFNGDGKQDWAVISFFPDYKKSPQEGFQYLLNDGNGGFTAHYIPDPKLTEGKWATIDVNDLNGDEKPDVLLGNLAAMRNNRIGSATQHSGSSLIILEGVHKKD